VFQILERVPSRHFCGPLLCWSLLNVGRTHR
jgi:hypothetical protein